MSAVMYACYNIHDSFFSAALSGAKAMTEKCFCKLKKKKRNLTKAELMKIWAQACCDICRWWVKNLVLLQRESCTFFLTVQIPQNTLQGVLIKHESTNRLSCRARENSHRFLSAQSSSALFFSRTWRIAHNSYYRWIKWDNKHVRIIHCSCF